MPLLILMFYEWAYGVIMDNPGISDPSLAAVVERMVLYVLAMGACSLVLGKAK